jgi:protein involved in polysaccharide export with SLBB domain
MTVEDVISLAGGYRDLADKKKVYIIRANGLSEKRSRNIFLKTQELSPGDTVVIPRKIFTTSPIIKSLTPITQILSDLSFSAAAIDNLKSN